MTDDLVKRLRARVEGQWTGENPPVRVVPDPDCQEAADRIEALERQLDAADTHVEELRLDLQRIRREALEEAARVCDARYMGDNNREDMEARRCAADIRALMGKE